MFEGMSTGTLLYFGPRGTTKAVLWKVQPLASTSYKVGRNGTDLKWVGKKKSNSFALVEIMVVSVTGRRINTEH